MTQQDVDNAIAKNESMVVAATYNVLFTNDIVIGKVVELVYKLKHSLYYKREIKREVNNVDLAKKKYERIISEIISDKLSFFADANEIFINELNHHIDVLFYQIKSIFDSHNISNSDLYALLELTRTLCEFSCLQLDKRLEELVKVDVIFQKLSIDYLRLTELLFRLNRLFDLMKPKCSIDLNTNECKLAIEIIAKKLSDCEIISKAIKTNENV